MRFLKRYKNTFAIMLCLLGLIIFIGSAGNNDVLGPLYPISKLIRDISIGIGLLISGLLIRAI